MPSQAPPPFHDDFLDAAGRITESWKRFLLKGQQQTAIPGTLTMAGAFAAIFRLTANTDVTFPIAGVLATVGGTVSSITGTANEIAASASVGAVVLSLVGPHAFTTLPANAVLYGNLTAAIQAVTLNASATNKFLTQASSGVPAFAVLLVSDIPDLSGVYSLKAGNTSLVTVGTLIAGATGAGFTIALSTSTVTGTLADARLSTNVPLLNVANVFTGNLTVQRASPALAFLDTGTSYVQLQASNSNANFYWGLENNAGGALLPGSTGNAAAFNQANNFPIQFGTNNTLRLSILGNGNVEFEKLVSKYNAIATVSNGVPSEVATIDTTGLTANVGATTLYAVPASGEGLYRISAYVVETIAGSLSSNLPNVQIVYTDKDSNTVVTIDATPVLGVAGIGQTGALNANTVGTASGGVIPIYVKASTTIQYQTVNYASNLAGMTYALHLKLEAL